MITIIDYGLGNIRAFVNVYERLNIKIKVAHNAEEIRDATKIILPGVGAFDYAMSQLNASGMRDELEKQVLENSIPILGICVGMQMLAKYSDEGVLPGLGWIDGEVKLFDTSKINYKTQLPHMGWNSISTANNSYYFACNNPVDVMATTEYGINYACAVNRKNIFGVQFHPEKSHSNGIQLLHSFAKL
jgi:imidazole glycerol-phosphate synthase subunit HisH